MLEACMQMHKVYVMVVNFCMYLCVIYIYIYIYIIYIYIYILCVFGQHFFVNAFLIKQYRPVLSTYFCKLLFQSPNWFYGVRQELIEEIPIIICYPSTFCLILGHHLGFVYCKSDVTFACTLLLCKCLLFIMVCCCSIFFVSMSRSNNWRHLSTLVLDTKLILLSLGCFILTWKLLRICNFCLSFCCSKIVVLW